MKVKKCLLIVIVILAITPLLYGAGFGDIKLVGDKFIYRDKEYMKISIHILAVQGPYDVAKTYELYLFESKNVTEFTVDPDKNILIRTKGEFIELSVNSIRYIRANEGNAATLVVVIQ